MDCKSKNSFISENSQDFANYFYNKDCHLFTIRGICKKIRILDK